MRRRLLPKTKRDLLASVPAVPHWEDATQIDVAALHAKFASLKAMREERLTRAEVFYLVQRSQTLAAERMRAHIAKAKPAFDGAVERAWETKDWRTLWTLRFGGRHEWPYQPMPPGSVWHLLSPADQRSIKLSPYTSQQGRQVGQL